MRKCVHITREDGIYEFMFWHKISTIGGEVSTDHIMAFLKHESGSFVRMAVNKIRFIHSDDSLPGVLHKRGENKTIVRMHNYMGNLRTGLGWRLFAVLERVDGSCFLADPTTCTLLNVDEPIEIQNGE